MKGCPHGGGDERALSKNCCPESTVLPTRAGMKLLLAICQKQGTRSPYTGAGKTGGLSEYARLVGKARSNLITYRDGAAVYSTIKNLYIDIYLFQDYKWVAAKLGLSLRNDNLTWSHHKEGAQHAPGCVLSDVKAIGYSALPKAARNGTGRLWLKIVYVNKLELSTRVDNLSWTHHREIAKLEPETPQRQGISAYLFELKRLRGELRAYVSAYVRLFREFSGKLGNWSGQCGQP